MGYGDKKDSQTGQHERLRSASYEESENTSGVSLVKTKESVVKGCRGATKS